jgi:hypothetical protein
VGKRGELRSRLLANLRVRYVLVMMLEPFSHVAVLAEYAQLPQQGPRDCSPLTASAGGFCKASDGVKP